MKRIFDCPKCNCARFIMLNLNHKKEIRYIPNTWNYNKELQRICCKYCDYWISRKELIERDILFIANKEGITGGTLVYGNREDR